MIKRKKYLLSKILMLLVLLLIFTSCGEKKVAKNIIPAVIVEPVFESYVIRGGNIIGQAVAEQEVDLQARVEGFLTKKCIADGQLVKKGELLYQIEKTLYEANYKSARANLENKKAVFNTAIIEYNRLKYLHSKNAVSRDDFDIATKNKDVANADVLDAEAQLEIAKLELGYTDIHAPFNGQIGSCNFSVGDLIGPGTENSGMEINNLVQLDPIRVEFNFSESVLIDLIQNKYYSFTNPKNKEKPKVLEHIVVTLKLTNGKEFNHKGVINFIDNNIDPTTGTVHVRALFPNPEYILRPGSFVTAFVAGDKKDKTLLIPQAAVMKEQAGSYVLTVTKDNIVKSKTVEVGDVYGEYIEVVKGLDKGELIICEGLQKVKEGIKVKYSMKKSEPDLNVLNTSRVTEPNKGK